MLANGGRLVKPTLLEGLKSDLGPRVISKEVADNSLLAQGCCNGWDSINSRRWRVFCWWQDGADKPSAQGGYHKEKNITNFASIFPINEPKYVLVITLDEAQDTLV